MQNNFQILSTKKISNSLISFAEKNHISIDQLSFIETEEIISAEIKNRIAELTSQDIVAIFTSSKAVKAVGKLIPAKISWKIFCIEPATKSSVEDYFENVTIAGAATNAEELADTIISDKSVKKVVFFCGNKRRNTLPGKLKDNGIEVEELVVYNTVEKPQLVSKSYDGILFFSPSAVRSFFSVNEIKNSTTLFAIGNTTAEEIKLFAEAKTIITEIPDQEQLIFEVIKYYTSIKTL
jgi:uroporphyrinogen-III synthase